VRTAELAARVELWIAEHQREHPPGEAIDKVSYGKGGPQHYRAERYICDQSGLSPARLAAIREARKPWTPLSEADRLLNAVGEDRLLGSAILIVGNPMWPRERVIRELQELGVDVIDQFWSWDSDFWP
jgi:hypothetical protein